MIRRKISVYLDLNISLFYKHLFKLIPGHVSNVFRNFERLFLCWNDRCKFIIVLACTSSLCGFTIYRIDSHLIFDIFGGAFIQGRRLHKGGVY